VAPPLVGEARLIVEAPAVGERVGEAAARFRCLVAHAREDLVAGCLVAADLGLGVLEFDHPGEVRVEPAALGGGDEHGAALDHGGGGQGMAVRGDVLVRRRKQHCRHQATAAARRRDGRRSIVLGDAGLDGVGSPRVPR